MILYADILVVDEVHTFFIVARRSFVDFFVGQWVNCWSNDIF